MVWLTSCQNLTPSQRQQVNATGSYLIKKAATLATQIVLNAAISQLDREKKEDWLDSLATGFYASSGSIVTSNDVREIAAIWAPAKPHWQKLAVNLAEEYENTPGSPRDKAIAVGIGLQKAAAQ